MKNLVNLNTFLKQYLIEVEIFISNIMLISDKSCVICFVLRIIYSYVYRLPQPHININDTSY